jgi:glycosyltransferase involved in cell wall biosynthesis
MVNEGLAGGVLRVAIEQTKHIRALGHDSFLATGFDIPYQDKFFGFQDFAHSKFKAPLPRSFARYFGGLVREFCGQWGNVVVQRDTEPDVIVCHNLSMSRDAFSLASSFGSKVVVVVHNPTYPPSLLNYVLSIKNIHLDRYSIEAEKLLKKADLVLAIHNYNVELVSEIYDVEARSILLGCNPLEEIPTHRGDYLLVASRLSLGKQVDKIAQAISLADNEAKVVFAGALHQTTGKVAESIKKTGLKNYKIFFNLPDWTFKRLFLGCRTAIYGLSETDFMMPACHGAPVVCLSSKYASDIFVNGTHGHIIKGEPREFPIEVYSEKIADLLADERKAWRIGHSAWKSCFNHSWGTRARELTKVLESID